MFLQCAHPSACPDGETLAEVDGDKKQADNWADIEGAQRCTRPKTCPDGEALVDEMGNHHQMLRAQTVRGPGNTDAAAFKPNNESIMGSVSPQEVGQTNLDKVPGLSKVVRFQLPPETIRASDVDDLQAPFFEIDGLGECCVSTFTNTYHSENWIGITDDWLLQKQILKEGQGQATRPDVGQEVTLKLLGVLEDGTIIDRDPKLTFIIGDGDVIQALEFCAFSMQLDEVALVISDGQYAYGHTGREPDVPADATVIYDVQLLNVRNAPDLKTLTVSDCIRICKQKRERGNYHFQREDYHSAVKSYNLALDVLNISSESNPSAQEAEELQEDGLKCLNNLAAAQLKLDLRDEVIASSNAVLQLDPNHVKALFRKGKLLSERGDYEEAMETLKRALKLEPSTKALNPPHQQIGGAEQILKGEENRLETEQWNLTQPSAIHAELSKLVQKRTGRGGTLKLKNSLCQKPGEKRATFHSESQKSGLAIPWKWLFGAAMVIIGSMVTSVVLAARG